MTIVPDPSRVARSIAISTRAHVSFSPCQISTGASARLGLAGSRRLSAHKVDIGGLPGAGPEVHLGHLSGVAVAGKKAGARQYMLAGLQIVERTLTGIRFQIVV